MVPDLSRVVVNTTTGLFDDFFQGHSLKLSAFLQVVEVDDIGVVVLAMVILKGFLAVIRHERVDSVGKWRQLVFHDFSLVAAL
jgi:hypothetical protein